MDHYEVIEVVGEGTYGVVFKCRDKRTGRIVAIKQFKNFQTNAYIRVTMLRELRVEQLLKGEPNVTQLLETFKQKNRLYLVMEYIPRSLLDLLEEVQHGLDAEALAVLMYTILLGIRSCHRNGIIHRDVKPENILVRDDGTASLCDFGFCRPLPQPLQEQQPPPPQQPQQPSQGLLSNSDDTGSYAPASQAGGSSEVDSLGMPPLNGGARRHSGASVSRMASSVLSELVLADHQSIMTNYVATRWYRSPEMLLGMTCYTYAVDMWAVGAIMAEAIDGEPLLPGKTELEQLSLIQSRVGDFPAAYEAAVRKRNGGVLRLRSLNPFAARAPQLGPTSPTQGSRRASLAGSSGADGGDDHRVELGTSSYLVNRFGARVTKQGLDLLHRLLRVDGAERIGVDEALEHPFFDAVRGRYDEPLSVSRAARSADEAGDDDFLEDARTLTDETAELTGTTAATTPSASPQEQGFLERAVVGCGPPLSSLAPNEADTSFLATAVAPTRVGVPSSRTGCSGSLDTDENGRAPFPKQPPQKLPPRRESMEAGAPPSAAAARASASPLPRTLANVTSTLSTSSLSFHTNTDESSDDEAASQRDGALPHLPDVLMPPAPRERLIANVALPLPPPEPSGEAAQTQTGSTSPPPHLPLPQEAMPPSAPVPSQRRQAASEGANWLSATAAARDASTHGEQRNSASPVHSRRSRDDQPELLQSLRRGAPQREKDGDVSRRRPPAPAGRNSAAAPRTDSEIDFSATLPSVRMRGPTKRGTVADTTEGRPSTRKSSLASTSRAKPPLAALAQSYSFKSSPSGRSRHLTRSLTHTVSQSTSTDDAVSSTLNSTAAQAELPLTFAATAARGQAPAETRATPPSRSLSHGSSSEKASPASGSIAKAATGAETAIHAADTSTSTRQPAANTNGGGLRRGGRGGRAAGTPPGPPPVTHKSLMAGSSRAAAAALADGRAPRRQGTANTSRPPQPRWRSVTPTGAAAAVARYEERGPTLPKPLAVQPSPETSVGASMGDARDTAMRGTDAPRFASPKLPRKVRPLPATERVTLLKEIESLGYSVGVPSEVEVLAPAAPSGGAEEAGPPPRYRRIESGQSSRRRQEGKTATRPSVFAAPTGDAGEDRGACVERGTASAKSTTRPPPPSGSAAGSRGGQARHAAANARTASPTAVTAPQDEASADGRPVKEVRVPATSTGASGRPPRMELRSLAGLSNTPSSTPDTYIGSRAAPSLFFRSSRNPSSPLKLTAAQQSFAANQADTAPTELSTSMRHASSSVSLANASLLVSPANGPSGYAGRLAPALLRHHHPHQHAGGRVAYTPPSLLPDACSSPGAAAGAAASSPHSLSSSPRLQRIESDDTRRSSQDTPIVSLSCTRQQQRRLSQNPIEFSLSGEVDTGTSTTPLAHGGQRGPGLPSPPSAPQPLPVSDVDDLETVVLVETPLAKRRNAPQPQLNSGSWSPTRSGTTAPMAAAESPSVLDGAHRYNTAATDLLAVATRAQSAGEDDVMNVSSATPLYCSPETIGKLGGASNATGDRSAPAMIPPQPLLGGAGVLSAQQLRAVNGRKKSRLVL